MATQYRNFDRAGAPQVVTIRWEPVYPRDDTSERPDQRDEGFWPSHDPNAHAYVARPFYDAEYAKAKARLEAWENDDWWYVGVIARAHVSIPIGGGAFTIYTFDSPGVWGIESDSEAYLLEVFAEEKATLSDHLRTFAGFVVDAPSGALPGEDMAPRFED
jgi:hypothetical protein